MSARKRGEISIKFDSIEQRRKSCKALTVIKDSGCPDGVAIAFSYLITHPKPYFDR